MSEVLVTAGGTREKLDDVRYFGNFSSGRLGHAIASEYARRGHEVTLIAPQLTCERFGYDEAVAHESFFSAAELQACLLGHQAAKLVIHVAAVADYRPLPVDGKISSNMEYLRVRMEKVPKILPQLRPHFGDSTTIVGFKLLSDVDEQDLYDAGGLQMEVADTDFCVANDLQMITPHERRVHLLGRDGTRQTFTGTTPDTAAMLASSILFR